MKRKQLIAGSIVLVALVALLFWARHHIHFDFGVLREQVANADWRKILIAIGCIYAGYIIRSVRWALLLRHHKQVPLLSLIGTQVIGFTAVALIGRVADLVRPYLVSRRTGLELSSQVAVYIVERLFDAGAMALIFSVAILQVPESQVTAAVQHSKHLAALSQSAPWVAVAIFRYGGLVLTLLGALFLLGIRVAGESLARLFESAFGLISKNLGRSIGHKIRTFHSGLDTMRSFSDFAATASLSIGMWVLIAAAYTLTMHAFTASPELANLNVGKCVLLMVLSGSASALQLPIIGWFTQIGVVAAAITGFFGASPEASTACAATLLLVTFLGIIPVGLIWAQVEGVRFKNLTRASEEASEQIADEARALD